MADRVVSVRLKIEMDQVRRDSRSTSQSLLGIASAAQTAGNSGQHLSRLASAAKATGAAVAGIGTVAVGGMAALSTSTLKTGISYNTLEQTSRAALKTVLGSASAATSQMEALREFGKSSPFPRQVWISAQQQLLAFGMAAEKVIPTLSAIQDAVAAAGGSSQQISEVTAVLARIQSTGKVTAEELNELGYRGIDAAKLVGEAMGKTAGEVRADITSQAISGQQFLDTLTASMSEHFAGAAAGVKQTWTGAVDRVKGAVRDIGGLLATPLVDPNGGGAAVEWANEVADALRALEARLQPVMESLANRAEPIFDAVSEKLEKLAYWIKTADFSAMWQKIQPMLPALAGLAAGFTVVGAKSLPIIGDMVSGLRPLPIALTAAAMASPELRQALVDLVGAAQPLIQAAADGAKVLAGSFGPALSAVAGALQPVIMVVDGLGNVLEALPGPVQTVVGALLVLKGLQMVGWLSGVTTAFANFRSEMDAQRKYAAMAGTSVNTMGAAYSVGASKISSAAQGIRGALTGAIGFLGGPWGAAIGAGSILLGVFSAASANAEQRQQEFADSGRRVADVLREQNGVVNEAVRAAVAKEASDKGLLSAARGLGVELSSVTEAVLDEGDAYENLLAKLQRIVDAETRMESVNNESVLVTSDRGKAAKQLANDLEALRGETRNGIQANKDIAAATGAAASAERDHANSAADSAANHDVLANSLYGVGDAADSAATRAQQLQTVLAGRFDAQFGLQKASDDFQGGLHALRDAFAKNDKAVTKSSDTSDKYNDALRRQQKIVKDTREQLEDLAEAQKKAEQEAAEAARNARQRALDEMFGKQFDVQSTLDAFRGGLAQAATDIADAKKGKTVGALSLTGFSEGALANRDRMRTLVQQAQAAIQAERDRGASATRISQVSQSLAAQLATQAAAWGLNAAEVKQYTDAIKAFGSLAGQKVVVDLRKVKAEFAAQRKEIHENSAEQMENARQSAASAQQQTSSASAVDVHTAALKGNSASALENREKMRHQVEMAQKELTQMHLNSASKEELTRRGEELADQLMAESIQLGFAEGDVREYTDEIKTSALEIARFPVLRARADVKLASETVRNFVKGVNRQLAKIQKNFEINVRTGSEYINSPAGGRLYAADGGFITGPGGPRDDKIPAMLSNREFVVNAASTAKNRETLEYINNGGVVPGFARGGYVDPINLLFKGRPSTGLKQLYDGIMRDLMPGGVPVGGGGPALQWAASQVGKPYIWGGVGPAGYDCSGFMSAITNVIQKRNPHARRFATGNFPTGDFVRGPGNFMIGSFRGNPGHMAGTLKGVNVESRGGEGVVVGRRARGALDSLFGGNVWHLKGYRDGGMVSGDPPFDLMSPIGMHFDKILGSYARGTDYVPMDGLYQLHRGEAVVPAQQNSGGAWVLEVRGDGSKAADFVIDSLNKGISTGRIRLVTK